MNIDIKPEDLEETIRDTLKDWSENEVHRQVNAALKETAEETAKLLRRGGPYHDRKGAKYTKDWDYKQRTRAYNPITMTETYTVYNKKHYRLTHLLEHGHQVMRGGRKVGQAPAFVHISPAHDFARDYLISAITRNIQNGEEG